MVDVDDYKTLAIGGSLCHGIAVCCVFKVLCINYLFIYTYNNIYIV